LIDLANIDEFNARSSARDANPQVVIWEVTRACHLACAHCRAEAIPHRHPLELTTEEGLRFLDQVVEARPAVFILTGGDPALRPDLLELCQEATRKGLRVALSPSATPRLLKTDFAALRRAGVRRMSLSLDGPDEASHDAFRRVKGTWRRTWEARRLAAEAGIAIQINTTITAGNVRRFDEFARLMDEIKPEAWTVFLLVPVGRATSEDLPSAEAVEQFLVRLSDHAARAPYPIKTTEAHHFRRILLQRRGELPPHVVANGGYGIRDAKGFVFISHTGEVCPSGFLPLVAGNVRTANLLDLYRNHPDFTRLRDSNTLGGKCGRCEYRFVCGGSRARAYMMTGDYMAEEPMCSYYPQSIRS
jgi:radical SAM protein with 4Fe4S-binding SPASM domain